jgi:hypothetical protein
MSKDHVGIADTAVYSINVSKKLENKDTIAAHSEQ